MDQVRLGRVQSFGWWKAESIFIFHFVFFATLHLRRHIAYRHIDISASLMKKLPISATEFY
jgi:hypothetical protein